MQETWVWSLGWEGPLEKGGDPSPTPVFWTGEFHGMEVHGLIKSGTWLSDSHFTLPDQRDKSATIIKIVNNTNSIPPSRLCVCVCVNCLVVSYSLQPHRLQPREAPLSMGFSRLEHWSGLPFPSPKGTIEGKKVKLLSRVWLFETPWTVAYQSPPSMEFSRQEYWSGLPFPSPRHKSKGLQSGRWVLGICMPGIS